MADTKINYVQVNIDCLQETQPAIFKKVADFVSNNKKSNTVKIVANKDKIPVNVMVSKDGDYIIHNTEKAEDYLADEVDPIQVVEIMYGLGLGGHIIKAMQKYPNKKWIIVEPDVEVFFNVLYVSDLTEVFKKATILLEEPYEVFQELFMNEFWNPNNMGLFNIRCHYAYQDIFDKEWQEFSASFEKTINNTRVDTSTRKTLIETWVSNYLTNSKKMYKASNAEGLIGKFEDVPGILVSAGPSLNKNIDRLKELKGKAIIIAASSARIILKQHGITPDFFITTDASEGEEKIVECDVEGQDYMLYANQVLPKSLDLYKGKKFWINYSSDFYSLNMLGHHGIRYNIINSAPSVANTAFHLLTLMGCNPICFVGQDLCYTDKKLYGGKLDHEPESIDFEKCIKATNVFGEEVYTTPSFLAMRNNFENTISIAKKTNPEIQFYNCTEGGIFINGAKAEILDNIKCKEIDIKDKISTIYDENLFGEEFQNKVDAYNAFLTKNINTIKDNLAAQLEKIKKLGNTSYKKENKVSKLCKQIDEISNMYLKNPAFEQLISHLVQIDFYFINCLFNQKQQATKSSIAKTQNYQETILKQNRILAETIKKIKIEV